jgi:excisionase family DNA binding protein
VLLTVSEVAKLLKVSRATVYSRVEREEVPAVRSPTPSVCSGRT